MTGQLRKVEHQLEVAPDVGGAGPVVLVHGEHVSHLQEAGLVGLHRVSHPGRDHDQCRVGRRRHVDLNLSHPDGLDDDGIEPGDVQHPDHAGHCQGEASGVAPGGHGTDEHPGSRGLGHADPVAEDGPTCQRRRWVDGKHRRSTSRFDQPGGPDGGQGGLPGPGWTGHPDHVGVADVTVGRLGHPVGHLAAPFDQGQQACGRPQLAATCRRHQLGNGAVGHQRSRRPQVSGHDWPRRPGRRPRPRRPVHQDQAPRPPRLPPGPDGPRRAQCRLSPRARPGRRRPGRRPCGGRG